MKSYKSLVASAVTALLVSAPLAAKADLSLCLDDAVGGFNGGGMAAMCVTDGSANDLNSAAGAITFVGSYGTYVINVSTAVGEPLYANGYGMDLNSINVGTGNLIIAMSQTGMQFGAGGPISINGAIGGVSGGSVGYQLFADDSNALFGQATQLFNGTSTGAFAATGGGTLNSVDGLFSLTSLVSIVHPLTGANTSFNFESQVPEPATLALIGLGLLGLGAAGRRKPAAR
jgi:hypothetical protein